MNFERGIIILAEIPFPDQQGVKTRPAVIVQNNYNNERLDDLIVAVITSNTTRVNREKTQMLVDVSSATGRDTGLTRNSAIKCENLVTVTKSSVKRIIGRLSSEYIIQLDECLKYSLDLS